jgi:hypothetical protein
MAGNQQQQQQAPPAQGEDVRFARALQDPRFMRPKKRATKVHIDARFSSMLSSTDFGTGSSAPVDKYGRRVQSSTAKDLKKFYHLSDDDDVGSDDLNAEAAEVDEEEDEDAPKHEETDAESEQGEKEPIYGYALARGEVDIESSDEEEVVATDAKEEEGFNEELGVDGSTLAINPLAAQVSGVYLSTRMYACVFTLNSHTRIRNTFRVEMKRTAWPSSIWTGIISGPSTSSRSWTASNPREALCGP